MTFKDALQAEINLQGLSVAQIAKDSSVSKGAIYNILNGTTEDARIRPATRKALAAACNREVRPDGDGVVFVAPGENPAERPAAPPSDSATLNWQANRPFLANRYAGEGFDWLHAMEEQSKLTGLRIVDRVFQNRAEFLSLIVSNQGEESISAVEVDLSVRYGSGPSHAFSARFTDSCEPGGSIEATVFACVGEPFELSVERAELRLGSDTVAVARIPSPFSFAGGGVD